MLKSFIPRLARRKGAERGARRCGFRREEGVLRIDCRGCPERRELTSHTCLRAVLEIMADENGVEGIMLAGEWEHLYAGHCIEVLQRLSELLMYCQDLSNRSPSFGICDPCPLNPRRFYVNITRSFPSIPGVMEVPHPADELPKYKGACDECRKRVISNIDHLHRELSSVGRSIASHVFHILGEENG